MVHLFTSTTVFTPDDVAEQCRRPDYVGSTMIGRYVLGVSARTVLRMQRAGLLPELFQRHGGGPTSPWRLRRAHAPAVRARFRGGA
jgi:hypothetical protein